MTLRRNTATNAAPAFELEDDVPLFDQEAAASAAAQAAPAPAPAPAQAAPAAAAQAAAVQAAAVQAAAAIAVVPAPETKARALANPSPQGAVVANSTLSTLNVLKSYKDALRVDYNTLLQISATQGSFYNRETEEDLGKELGIELLSFQDSYVVSPNDDDAEKDLVKYSEDGVTCKDGTLCADHLRALQDMGYDKAKISHRVVVVAAVESCPASPALVGELVQVDLAPSSKRMFDRLMVTVAYKVGKGILTQEKANHMVLKTSIAKGEGKNTYTLVTFSLA